MKALPAASRDTLLAAVVAVLAFTPGIADKGTSLGWTVPQKLCHILFSQVSGV